MVIEIKKASLIYQGAKYKGRHILKDIDLEINDNEFTCLLGPSGCGKSTLLGLIAGFVKASSGAIIINKKQVMRPDINRSLVFQEYALFPWLDVIENVAFGLKYRVKDKEERFLIAMRYLKMVGLQDHAKDTVAQLSGGMKQRVAIARALAVEPELLLMDEPFGALDDQTRSQMQKLITEIWLELKSTIIFVTHSIDEALLLADRIIVMASPSSGPYSHGEIKADIRIKEARPRDLAKLNNYRREIQELLYQKQNFDAGI